MSAPIDPAAPIGVFDSGLGGLTVARAILEALPRERIVYLGDTARVPYGTRSPSTVIRYARGCANRLRSEGVKVLVVACNTVSAVALDMLRVELDVPVVGVIEPGARAGIAASRLGRVGVIATRGTVASGAYVRAVAAIDSRVEVHARPAPLLVPLVEEGWLDGDVPRLAIERYLAAFNGDGIDALVLGCTHYPILRDSIASVGTALFPDGLAVVDGAEATAHELRDFLVRRGLARATGDASLRILVTDVPDRFAQVAARFLGRAVDDVPIDAIDL